MSDFDRKLQKEFQDRYHEQLKICDALREENERLKAHINAPSTKTLETYNLLAESQAEVERLKGMLNCNVAEIIPLRKDFAEAVKVIELFASIKADDGDDFSGMAPQTVIRCEVTVADLNAARAFLAKHKGEM